MPEQEKQLEGQEIKNHILEILLEFQRCCEQNGLRFYLSGGTLLGAVRHKGFIPWDDDVDVCMPRPDYEELIRRNRGGNLFPSFLKLVCYEEGTLSYPFMKLLDTRTRIERAYIAEDESDHLWIDIFPVDGLPQDAEQVRNIYRRASSLRKFFMLTKAREGTGKTRAKSMAKRVVVPFLKLFGTEHFSERIVRLARQYAYEESDQVGVITWGLYGEGERMEKGAFEKACEVSFEGRPFPAMSCKETYLSGIYGDYMRLPPEQDRESHDMKVWMKT